MCEPLRIYSNNLHENLYMCIREVISVYCFYMYVLILWSYSVLFVDFAPAHAEVQPHWLAQPSPVWGTLDAVVGCGQPTPTPWGYPPGGEPRLHVECMCWSTGSDITAPGYQPETLSRWSHHQHSTAHSQEQWCALPGKQVVFIPMTSS